MFSSFFESPLPHIGIDLSDKSLKLARVVHGKRTAKMLGAFERAVPRGLYVEGRVQQSEALAQFLRDTFSQREVSRFAVPHVVAALPEGLCFIRVMQLPEIPEEEIAKALPWETEGVIPLSVDKAYLDWRIIGRNIKRQETSGEEKPHIDVLLAAADRAVVDEYAEVLCRAHLVPAGFEPESIAVTRALLKPGVSYPPVLIMDVGGSRTVLSIVSGQSLRVTASISISSTDFTERIARECKVSFKEAEERKRRFGILPEGLGKENFEAVTPLLADLTEQLQGYFEYYRTHAFHEHELYTLAVQVSESSSGTFDFRPIARGEVQVGRTNSPSEGTTITSVLLAGGGSSMPGLAEYLVGALSIPVKHGDALTNIVAAKSLRSSPDTVGYAAAFGLAMHPLKETLKLV